MNVAHTNPTVAVRQRRRIYVQGIVQGVGFRPFIYTLAHRWQLAGSVNNDSHGVTIEVEGPAQVLDTFEHALHCELPPLARIDALQVEEIPVLNENTFHITQSQVQTERRTLISPDTTICADCLRELFDPQDRRFHYPFINCTNCGPRFTIIKDVPYDRDQTTMRVFPMCPTCQHEYEDPLNRRFHAQPNACPVCGPQVHYIACTEQYAATGTTASTQDAIMQAATALAAGAILAIKGLGGYHLACDALNERAVQRLRQRKHREAKPFALMVADLSVARTLCEVSDAEAALLQSYRRPIVLLQQKASCPVASGIAPNHATLLQYLQTDRKGGENPIPPLPASRIVHSTIETKNQSSNFTLGIMLAYTPLHYLLLHACAEIFPTHRPVALVMTSANLSEEPIAYKDEDARTRLAPIMDGMLLHNREIHMRCDDSVTRIVAGEEQLIRRSRGYVPEPLNLAWEFPQPVLACGAHLKNTFCLGKGKQAFMSHHIGDLENLETLLSYREGITHFQHIFDIQPTVIVHDLHPDYLATQYALDSPIEHKIGVQHHHAHIASVMAEHGLSDPVIGIAADGSGYGTDGAIWGGEIMIADLTSFERKAHLAYVPLPGGEQAVRQPWRMAAVYLQQTYGESFQTLPLPFIQQLDRAKWHTLAQMIERRLNCPLTSSLGRLFDGVAALMGLRTHVLYEGQAAIELEMLATSWHQPVTPYSITQQWEDKPVQELSYGPLVRAVVEDLIHGIEPAQSARRFHRSVAALLAQNCLQVRAQTGITKVALSGGVFQNKLLLEDLISLLQQNNFQVYRNRRVPPNDGGLALGQAAIAAAQLRRTEAQYNAANGEYEKMI
jgi:Hydrogenase maturation factor